MGAKTGWTHEYYYDGGKLLEVEWKDTANPTPQGFRLVYDAEGVAGIEFGGSVYAFVKDGLGNVATLVNNSGNISARYLYDAWGRCKVIDSSGNELTLANNATHPAILNPIRWKSQYLDQETRLVLDERPLVLSKINN